MLIVLGAHASRVVYHMASGLQPQKVALISWSRSYTGTHRLWIYLLSLINISLQATASEEYGWRSSSNMSAHACLGGVRFSCLSKCDLTSGSVPFSWWPLNMRVCWLPSVRCEQITGTLLLSLQHTHRYRRYCRSSDSRMSRRALQPLTRGLTPQLSRSQVW